MFLDQSSPPGRQTGPSPQHLLFLLKMCNDSTPMSLYAKYTPFDSGSRLYIEHPTRCVFRVLSRNGAD